MRVGRPLALLALLQAGGMALGVNQRCPLRMHPSIHQSIGSDRHLRAHIQSMGRLALGVPALPWFESIDTATDQSRRPNLDSVLSIECFDQPINQSLIGLAPSSMHIDVQVSKPGAEKLRGSISKIGPSPPKGPSDSASHFPFEDIDHYIKRIYGFRFFLPLTAPWPLFGPRPPPISKPNQTQAVVPAATAVGDDLRAQTDWPPQPHAEAARRCGAVTFSWPTTRPQNWSFGAPPWGPPACGTCLGRTLGFKSARRWGNRLLCAAKFKAPEWQR